MSNRIGAYLRVSTTEQTTEVQEAEIKTYLASRGWCDFVIYEDKATGTNNNRPALKELLRDAKERKLDTVVVWKLDRFARSLKDLILMLQELSELGVTFISLKDNLDLTTSAGRLMLHLIGAFAEFEASIIKERVRAGIANAKSKGIRLGRPSEISTAKVLELRHQNWSLGKIAKYLNCSKAGVHKILSQKPSTNAVNNTEIIRSPESVTKL